MDSLRSYILETPSGSQYRSNQSHILKSNESAKADNMDNNVTNTTEQNSGENHSVKTKDKTDNLYITRNGRGVKPVHRYCHDQ